MVRSLKGYRNEGVHTIAQLNDQIKRQFTSEQLAVLTRPFGKNWSRLTKNQKYELLITNKNGGKDPAELIRFLDTRFPLAKKELPYPAVSRSQGAALFGLKIPFQELVECIYAAAKLGLTVMQPIASNVELLSSLVKHTGYMIPLSIITLPAATVEDPDPKPVTQSGYHFFGIYRKNPGCYFLKQNGFSIKERAVRIPLTDEKPLLVIKAFVFETGVLNQFLLE